MYVCICLAVTESEVEGAIANGAHTREAVTRACKAGGDCGACHHAIENMIEDHLEDQTCPGLVAASALVRTRAA
jgi:bacterioferritin-associated ferredoxin